MGGGTGLIGDPSGKSAERQLMTRETVEANVQSQRRIFEALIDFGAARSNHGTLVNNIDWLGRLSYLDALRDIGKFFSVNAMIQRDSVRDRLHNRDQGISYTEFTYQILQSYDYLVLCRDFKKLDLPISTTLQMGGSDQWGNIVGGTSLIDRAFTGHMLMRVNQSRASIAALSEFCSLYPERARAGAKQDKELADLYEACADPLFLLSNELLFNGDWATVDMIKRMMDWDVDKGDPYKVLQACVQSGSFQSVLVKLDRVERDIGNLVQTFGLTCPLITKADGGKFGKTESGAIWLTAPQPGESGEALKSRTTPYAYYQFWLNAADADVGKFLRIFTLLPRERIEGIEAEHAKDPARRHAQKELARAATLILHGEEGVKEAEGATAALFGGNKSDGEGNLRDLSLEALTQAFAAAPTTQHARALLETPGGLALTELLPQTSLAKSKTEARTALTEGSISINGETLPKDVALARKLSPADLLHGQVIALRRGKKNWHITRWS
jgi:tyrosyl-tRNA synthetase